MIARGIALVAVMLPLLASANDMSQGDPQLDYMLQCQGCHLADGRAIPEAGIPTMNDLADRFFGAPGGRDFLVQVPGSSQAPLSDRALASLMNWMLERFQTRTPRQPIRPYTEEEVARARARTPIDVTATRARLLAHSEQARD